MSETVYKFGTYDAPFTLTTAHTQQTASGDITVPAGSIILKPWVLKHVIGVSETTSTQDSVIGIPDKPSECAYIYDTSGPVRTITVTGVRYDNEEEISNLDFIHTQFNQQITHQSKIPFTGRDASTTYYSVGIEWLTSTMQTTLRGYTFIIETPSDESRISSTQLNVGLTGFSYSFEQDNPGVIKYTLTLVERVDYNNGPVYREYISGVTKG